MYDVELYHHGIRGQKWGVRRFQDYDGTSLRNAYVRAKTSKTAKRVELAKQVAKKRIDELSSAMASEGFNKKSKGHVSRDEFYDGNKKLIKLDKKGLLAEGDLWTAQIKQARKESDAKERFDKTADKQYKKALNKIDQGIAEETRDYHDNRKLATTFHDKANKYKDKAEIASEKGKLAKAEKLQAKSDKLEGAAKTYDKAASEHLRNISKGSEITQKYIARAQREGLKVSSKRTNRSVTRGSEWVANYMSALVGAYTGYTYMRTYSVEGRHYNVRRPK